MEKINAVVLGATGMVGQRFVKFLSQHPWFNLASITASEKSAGKKYVDGVDWVLNSEIPSSVKDKEIQSTEPSVNGEIAFSALPSNVANEVEKEFARNGYAIASNASSHRMEKDVPLVIPEINPSHLDLLETQKKRRDWSGFIVTNPNCSTIILTLPLKPINEEFNIQKIKSVTLQAVSGAGYDGVPSMAIIDNAIPYIGKEENKMENETKKLFSSLNGTELDYPEIEVSAQCNRVPVTDGHMESVWIETEENVSPNEIKGACSDFVGVPQKLELPSAPAKPLTVKEEKDRPQPRLDRNEKEGMAVSIGRVRRSNKKNEFKLTLLGHNTIRGAAGASILNAELLYKKGYIG